MIDSTATTVLLAVSTILLCVSFIGPRLRAHWPLWLRVLARAATFVALTLLVQRLLGSPLDPHYGTTSSGRQFWEQLVEAGWWVVAARAAVGVARLVVVLEDRPRETRIVSDLLAGAVYIATTLAIINFAFEVPIRGLVATSGVIAIVLGLALQNTLSDVFSGVAVGLERPYKPGDLLWVEGGIEGTVVQINWRSTQISTVHGDVAVVPNSIIAKSRLVNRSAPTPRRGASVAFTLDAAASQEACRAVLRAAIMTCRIPLAEPAPVVACIGAAGDGVGYEISYYVATSDDLRAARTEIFGEAQRHLRAAGIALAVAGNAAPPPVEPLSLAELLAASDLFGLLEEADRTLLAEQFTARTLEVGDVLVREGDVADTVYMIATGAVEVTRPEAGGRRVLYRAGPGENIGAVTMFAGTPYTATATALTPGRAYRLERADIRRVIKARPELLTALETVAQRGQAVISRNAIAMEAEHLAEPDVFLHRLRTFLRVLTS
ncbi:cyclic nucleotide-binding domain-containing protein [Acidisphaera rubrifaciens]|uniref:Small-conductance mechanosensitive channel n=1 Tax=Acidisphaera rubrifaciens HS-AP3 TaxID=1231350 RepID=A0A0D6P7Z0_9PROT|nr:mechanosensitive ion channel family protein [Acidisphaera rubrifaciens]GAN76979.1 mechanosensitive ion channel small-conductance MscS [Acidisphaera rubrifaciens HS-AP3]